jgi:spermidine/putrescine transport system substrate-binding protein
MYPDSSIVARCAMIHDAGDHTPEVLDMWSKVKRDNLGGGIVIFLLAVVLALTVFVAIKKHEWDEVVDHTEQEGTLTQLKVKR